MSLFVLIGCQTNFNLQQHKRSHKVRPLFIPAIAMDESLLPYSLNNFPLPDDLVPLWASEIDHISHSISIHDQRMKGGVASIERHTRQRVELCDWKDFITSLRSAVRRLPAEVIAQIIFFSLELDRKALGLEGRQWFMTLRSVSSSWRRTAFSTARSMAELGDGHCSDTRLRHSSDILAFSWRPENKLHLQLQSTKYHDSFDTIVPLIEHPSFRFSTLVLGLDILPRWKCFQSFMQPSASKATVEALTLRLPLQPPENPPVDHVPPGASIIPPGGLSSS
ncbi:hypothetical protein BKA70DRAFT_1428847 [Coprinopsis sp. MPI-PUGE-AT-0042]|nr:hypothetical protein BKA70DRAFT_1428847 [Coprinopsis sp. MPI-PUGE-AT-0042]